MEDNDLSIIIKKANYVNSFYSNIIENISYLPSSISIFSYALMHMWMKKFPIRIDETFSDLQYAMAKKY